MKKPYRRVLPTLTLLVVPFFLFSCEKHIENDTKHICVTAEAKDVSETHATVYGYANLTNDMTGSIKMGFIVSETQMPSLDNGTRFYSKELNSENRFFVTLSGLQPGTKFYYRAFVYRNEVYNYGEVQSFITDSFSAVVTTGEVTSVSEKSASISSSVSIKSKDKLACSMGILFSQTATNKEAIIASGTNKRSSNVGGSNYSCSITGLKRGESYYYLAYGIIEGVLYYGEVKSFTTKDISMAVSTGDATDISESRATLNGSYSIVSEENLSTQFYFVWSNTPFSKENIPTNAKKERVSTNGSVLSLKISGLDYGKEYHFLAYAIVDGQTFYGEVRSFSTRSISATVVTGDCSNISEHKATISGSFQLNTIDRMDFNLFLYYDKNANTKENLISRGTKVSLPRSEGSLSKSIESLSHSTTYYYIITAEIKESIFTGELKSFTTNEISGTIQTGGATEIKYHDAILNGKFSNKTIEKLRPTYGFYISSTASTKSDLKNNGMHISVQTDEDGSFYYKIADLQAHQRYYYLAYMVIEDVCFLGSVMTFETKEPPTGSIDLGLSVCWAPRNIGASDSKDCGEYYSWGETTPTPPGSKTPIYSWCIPPEKNNQPGTITKYNTKSRYGSTDNKTVLDLNDDVAHVKMGGNWRIPTYDEWKELLDNCTWERVSVQDPSYSYGRNGKGTGFKITSKKNGYTDRSIFLPSAGRLSFGSSMAVYEIWYEGFYWSSSLYIDNPWDAWYIDFGKGDPQVQMRYYERIYGCFPIRPVAD